MVGRSGWKARCRWAPPCMWRCRAGAPMPAAAPPITGPRHSFAGREPARLAGEWLMIFSSRLSFFLSTGWATGGLRPVPGHGGANERLQGLFIDLVALMEI